MSPEERSRLQRLLELPDNELAGLYSDWSEAYMCAGWLTGGEQAFVGYLAQGPIPPKREIQHEYERKTLAKIRQLLQELLTE